MGAERARGGAGIGLLLPCNVCVSEEAGGSVVSIARPGAMFELVNRQDVQPVAATTGVGTDSFDKD